MAETCERCGASLEGRAPQTRLCLACREERDRELEREYKQRQKEKPKK